jgi:hypothetical protein
MENCVRTARQAGVFKEFHILTDRSLEECECYDAYQIDRTDSLFKLHYLKVGMSRLNFDHFIWLDPETVFVRNPREILEVLGSSPLHVPLEANLSEWLTSNFCQDGKPKFDQAEVSSDKTARRWRQLEELFREEGISNQVYVSGSSFWIVHHDAIETVYELALGFWHQAKERGLSVDVSSALCYATQILCADSEFHSIDRRPDLWCQCEQEAIEVIDGKHKPWQWRHLLRQEPLRVDPAIIHLKERSVDSSLNRLD